MSGTASFEYKVVESWPPLAWLARCRAGERKVDVYCGAEVERHDEWFCEAVWDGDYAAGDLDRTDIVFGSGGRKREGGVTFVSAGSTLDRLHSLCQGRNVWVSNSLPCLLSAVGADVDPTYPDYVFDFRTICKGYGLHKADLASSAGPVRLTYYDNLRWDGFRLMEVAKPDFARDFGSFGKYKRFLTQSLAKLSENLSSHDRAHPYALIATMSSGYDSPAIVALAREVGLREAISFRSDWRGVPDSGDEVARMLGVDLEVIERGLWRQRKLSEVPFLAADANGGDVDFQGFEHRLSGRVLLTGHMGYMVWEKRTPGPRDHRITRKDHAGLSLTEYRLWAGFIHCPVPTFGVSQIADITAIGRSPEMGPWDVGGRYNRPIPRRIVEEAGVPRGMFAVQKKGVSIRISEPALFWSGSLADDYLRWLDAHAWTWLRSGRLPPRLVGALVRPLQALARSVTPAIRRLGGRPVRRLGLARRLAFFGSREYLYKFVFPWALSRAKDRYHSVSHGQTASSMRHMGSSGRAAVKDVLVGNRR